jgi:hypothetical protein
MNTINLKSTLLKITALLAMTLSPLCLQSAAAAPKKQAGPNGGRLIAAVDPTLEFFVSKDRRVQITALDAGQKPVPLKAYTISVVAGDRSKPTKLEFTEVDGKLVSSGTLPDGNDFPVSVAIKPVAGGKTVYEKFQLNMSSCSSCKFLEYACVCDH